MLAVVTEEALRTAGLFVLHDFVHSQPAWSDLPFIVLTHRGGGPDQNPATERLSELLRNVTFLERPFHPATFVSVARTAIRSRDRQFEARARIEDIHERERQLNTALNAGKLGSWELDLATQTLVTSTTCKAVFGRQANDDFSYEALIEGVHPDDRVRMRETVQKTISDGADYGIECQYVWPDGTLHWVDIRARHVRGRSGRQKLVGVSSEITERKVWEQALQEMNESLEARVAERTRELKDVHQKVLAEIQQRELAELQLRQAQKLEMIGQLTGGVAHDFNNLLMAVLGNLELLRKHVPQDAKLLRLIEGARRGAERGSTLTQRLLAFARRQDLKPEPIDLSHLVTEMADLIERSAGGQIVVRLLLATDLPRAMLDRNQVELALLNLVVNARDAMPDGGTLSITTSRVMSRQDPRLADGVYVRLAVEDTGSGMDEETLEKATQPFFSTKEIGKGTGLGLSMVHGLANQLNGALALTSRVGHGTTAELWLPTTEVRPEDSVEAESIVSPSSGKLRILLVDDDALIAMSSADMLEDLGHDVCEAQSGVEGLEILGKEQKFDLVITDYSMPKMNGIQFAKLVRERFPELPILMATGYAEMPAKESRDVEIPRIAKPYSQEQLAAEIAKWVPKALG